MLKKAKKTVFLSAILYGWTAWSFHPRLRELMDPAWHREIPIRAMMRGLTRLLPALYNSFGEPGVRALQYVFYRVGEDRAPILREYLQIDPYDARSLGRVLDYEDGLVGVRGTWTEETKGKAVKEERYCPAARELTACPEVCTCLMMAMEAGTFFVLNPDLKVPELVSLLSMGDPCCLAAIELEDIPRREGNKASPQATPGAYPPRLVVQGLQGKLALQSVRSLLLALWTLLTKGPNQPMHWYEFFRYQPQGISPPH